MTLSFCPEGHTSGFHANQGFIGAGTGLGKSLMVWDSSNKRYFPVASEGGHADIPLYDPSERALRDYIVYL